MEKNIPDRFWSLLFTFFWGASPFTFCAVPKLFTKCPEYLHACDGSREGTIRMRDFLVTCFTTNCCNRDLFLFHSKQDKTFAEQKINGYERWLARIETLHSCANKRFPQTDSSINKSLQNNLRGENKDGNERWKYFFVRIIPLVCVFQWFEWTQSRTGKKFIRDNSSDVHRLNGTKGTA